MGTKELTVNSVVVMDEERGEYRQFFDGDVFDEREDAHLLAKIGDHCFAKRKDEVEEDVDLTKMKVPQLLAICEELGVEPRSSKKQDLINAIQSADAVLDTEEEAS